MTFRQDKTRQNKNIKLKKSLRENFGRDLVVILYYRYLQKLELRNVHSHDTRLAQVSLEWVLIGYIQFIMRSALNLKRRTRETCKTRHSLKRQCHPLRIRSAHNKPIFGICRKRSKSQHSDYKNVHIFTFSAAEKSK
jgi:hypothetical protein